MKKLLGLGCCFVFLACSGVEVQRTPANSEDPYLWLEEVEGAKALSWVKERNEETFQVLKSDPSFPRNESEIREILLAKDRVPGVGISGGWLYNFWQDETHVRGVWRRTTIESYKSANPEWDVILDLDKLAKEENENWVWKGSQCRVPEEDLCLISLSRGGKDAKVTREFDLVKRTFVRDGFVLPEAKSQTSWIDRDTLYVLTDFGEGSLSKSGYPIVAKEWKRGTPLSEAKEIYRASAEDVYAWASVTVRPEGKYAVIGKAPSFFEQENIYLAGEKRHFLPMPRDAVFSAIFKEHFIYQLRSDLSVGSRSFPKGSVVALPVASVVAKGNRSLEDLSLIFAPTRSRFVLYISTTKDHLLFSLLDNVRGRIARVSFQGGSWVMRDIPLGKNGMASVSSTDDFDNRYVANYMDYLTPSSIYLGDASSSKAPRLLKRSPDRFDPKGMEVEQKWTTSKDGTKIPYFLVSKKGLKRDGKNPTLMYGYGGFENPLTPWYSGGVGKVWLERGGVYVVANIRGGGEFGPAWHQAALRENRQKAFDDFIAVAEDLVAQKITAPDHLGIQGGSNGGLLVGSVFVQRPDLFAAVLCEVPLLDMLRYHLLLAGASWIGEYGNPENPADREFLSKYSPYQNVSEEKRYPEVFFLTSTKDDRVHPGHARKMVARMREFGHPVFYFENTEGGHGGAANLEQRVLWSALEYTYLWRKLSSQAPGRAEE